MSSYVRMSQTPQQASGSFNASLNGIPFRLNPLSIQLNFSVKTSEIPTLGGMVVQVYGVEISDLVVTGTFGVGGWQEQLKFLNNMLSLSQQQGNQGVGKNPLSSVRFLYPNRYLDFLVWLKDYTSSSGEAIDYENANIAPDWQLTFVVDTDQTNGALSKVAADAFISKLANGLGYTLSAYQGQLSLQEVETYLAQTGYSDPTSYLNAVFGNTSAAGVPNPTSSATSTPQGGGTAATSAQTSLTILGPSTLSSTQLLAWWNSNAPNGGAQPSNLKAPISQVIGWYISEGNSQNVRGDVAFAQSILETGYFTNSDTSLNNYAGIAHYNNAASGSGFDTPQDGIRAQIQALYEIAFGSNNVTFAYPRVGPTWGGKFVTTWAGLSANWATDPNYATSIMKIYGSMLQSAGIS